MKFDHVIEINDPLNPLIDPLTREQLWRGLVLRAEAPKMFVPYLAACEIFDRTVESILRDLHYGELVIRDRVTFVPQQQIRCQIPAQKDIPASSLTMATEEPQPGIFLSGSNTMTAMPRTRPMRFTTSFAVPPTMKPISTRSA